MKGLADKARNLTGATQFLVEGSESNKVHSHSIGSESLETAKNKDKELMEVAKKFEAILIHQMLKEMRKTIHKSDLLDSFSLQQFESMMDEEIAGEMAKHKGIGLADSLFYQLSRLEKDSNPPIPISNNFPKVNPYE